MLKLTKNNAVSVRELDTIRPGECRSFYFEDEKCIERSRGILNYYRRTRNAMFLTRVFAPYMLRKDCGEWTLIIARQE